MYVILNILPVNQFIMFQSVLIVVKYRKKVLPAYFYEYELLQVLNEVHSCRQSRKQWIVRQPLIKSKILRFSLRSDFVTVRNKFGKNVNLSLPLSTLKNKIKECLMKM